MSNLRIELTDQPGSVVGGLVEQYAALARGDGDAGEALEWLQANLVDSTGHRPGVTEGTFKPVAERAWKSLRTTAAEVRVRRASAAPSAEAKAKAKTGRIELD